MLYELITLSSPPMEQDAVSASAHNWVLDGEGQLLGAWRTEIGELFQIKLLRGFETAEALERERLRALMSARPFVKRNLKLIQLRTQTQLEINTPTHAVIGWVLPPLNCVCV